MAKLTVYCEGTGSSYDNQLLTKVFEGKNTTITGLGGVGGASAIIQYLEKAAASDKYIYFRDRDFDFPLYSTDVSLQQHPDKERVVFVYRVTIENYLFDAQLFFDCLVEKKEHLKFGLHSVGAVQNLFIDAARRIAAYQAVRHAMSFLRTEKTNIGTTWLGKSGELPLNLSLADCQKQGFDKIAQAKQFADNWTEANFLQKSQEFYDKFQQDDFYQKMDFLTHFQGKDLAKSITQLKDGFPIKSCYKKAVEHFDYKNFPDLIELRAMAD